MSRLHSIGFCILVLLLGACGGGHEGSNARTITPTTLMGNEFPGVRFDTTIAAITGAIETEFKSKSVIA